MRFLCDEMLTGLARWLRAAGYDTACAPRGAPDRALVDRARVEARWLVTRDRKIAEFRAADRLVLVLAGPGLPECAAELTRRLGVDWLYRPFTRCLLCNSPVHAVARDRVAERVPPHVASVYRCGHCDKLYWEGGHVRRMRARLHQWDGRGRNAIGAPIR